MQNGLRERAAEILKVSNKNIKANSNKLIEELCLYQIELELQNIHLMESNSRLQELQTKYADLYHLAPVGYFTLNSQGLITDVNTAGTTLLEEKKKKLINRSLIQYICEDTQFIFSDYFRQLAKGNAVSACEVKLKKRNNECLYIKIEGKIIPCDELNNPLFLIVISDLSHYQIAIENEKLRQNKLQAEKNSRAKDIFLATLSHELRTPITAILCWTRALKNKVMNIENINKGIQAIEDNILIQNQLVNDLIDISSIVLDKISINLRPIDLIFLIQSSIEAIQSDLEAKKIEINFVTEWPELMMNLDADRMRQVFYNLLTNAIKFTHEGGKIDVLVCNNKNNIQIKIQDNGQGISPEFLPYLFDQFFQVDPSYSQSKSGLGLGLGLFVVNKLLKLQDGQIEAYSDGLNRGSTFVVSFPLLLLS